MSKTTNVLVSIPTFYSDSYYLPYIWSVLKTHCNHSSSAIRSHCRWLPPIYQNKPINELLKDYKLEKIDVLCLSCYVWNSQLNYAVAGMVKEKNPRCLVVAGGPDIDHKDDYFFRENPQIDVVVKQDGEIPLSKILVKYLADERDFNDIPGLIFRENGKIVDTGLGELQTDFAVSPYLTEKEYFRELVERHNDMRIFWESNRGCPYNCSFCNWGSTTNAKIRKIPIKRLYDELEWFAHDMEIDHFIIIDANFGILPRDLEITDKLVKLKGETGFPSVLIYFPDKNTVERTVEISKRFYNSKLIPFHTLGIQHTDKRVLHAMNRKEISLNRQKKVIEALNKDKIPTIIQVIMGIPGDTPELWKKTITDVMELGCHEEYRTNIFNLLRGSPAWSEEYRREWEIQTVSRYTSAVRRKKDFDFDIKSKSDYVIQTKTYTRDDWIEMYLFDIMTQAFHNGGITRFLSIYLCLTEEIGYQRFYNDLFDKLCRNNPPAFIGKLFKRCEEHLHNFTYAPDDAMVFEEMEIDDLPNSPNLYKPEEYVLFKFLTNYSQLWEELGEYLETTYGFVENLDSIINYQKEIIVTPDYDFRKGKIITLKHNWPEYFKKARMMTGSQHIPGPGVLNKKARIKDMTCGAHSRSMLTWVYKQGKEQMLENFLETVIGRYYTRAERTYFKKIKIME